MHGDDSCNRRILFKLKKGHTKEDTIIYIGQAKGLTLHSKMKKFRKRGITDFDIIELASRSRKELRSHDL